MFDWEDDITTSLVALAWLDALTALVPLPFRVIHRPDHLHIAEPDTPNNTAGPSELDGGLILICCEGNGCDPERAHMVMSQN